MHIRKLFKNILIFASVGILVIAGIESSAETSNPKVKSINDTSFKSFIKQINQNYGNQYASRVEELFEILLNSKKVTLTEKESHFMEFDVLKMEVVTNKTRAVKINNGDVVHANDKCKISFTTRIDCFIYIFKVRTTGEIFPLFPRKKI